MKLYNYWRSSASWRVRIALNYKGLSYEYAPIHIVDHQQDAPEYKAKNPMAQVPTLELSYGERTIRLGQSLAIIEFLDEQHPMPRLFPSDPFLRARCRQLAEIVNAGIQPFQNLPALAYVRDELGGDDRAFAKRWNARGLEALEKLVPETASTFCIGDQPSVADLCLVPQIYSARRFEVDLASFPTLLRIEAACNEHPAFIAAHPDRQPDAPRT